jgi:hypothetical protein
MTGRSSPWAQYTRLFAANVFALIATGIATVALALLAFDLAGDGSGAVLGAALSLKMAINVLAPIFAQDLAARVPRKAWLVALCLIRGGVLLFLPFVTAVWQIFFLLAVFEFAAAASRAAYLAIVADMLTDEAEYAAAAAKARVAYYAEGVFSPLVAAALLGVIDFRGVFVVSVVLFAAAAFTNARVQIPASISFVQATFSSTLDNIRRMIAAPDVRGALALSAAAVLINAMVLVNTVVLVRGYFALDDRAAAIGLAAFGAGGIVAALRIPSRIAASGERLVMLGAGAAMSALLLLGSQLETYPVMLVLWFALGACTTFCHLPIQPLLRRLSAGGERQGIYAAHYSIDYSFLLVAYLLAGWVGAELGLKAAFISIGMFAALAVAVAAALWPPKDAVK